MTQIAPFALGRSYQRILVHDVDVMVACGLHAWERHPEHPNRLRVSADLYRFAGADQPLDPADFIDYDRVRAAILAWQTRPHTDLLEELVEDLVATCFADRRVEGVCVRVVKPEIFPETAAVGIEVMRLRPASA